MFFHLMSVANNSNVVIKTADTDCLIIGLGCKDKFHNSINIWFEVGTQNNVRLISLNQLYSHIGEKICKALPFYHAFTGCDYTSSFSRRGKVKPLKILENLDTIQDVFVRLSEQDEISDSDVSEIESFVCKMYGKKKLVSIDEARFHIFADHYKTKNNDQRLSSVKKLEGSSLPPCRKVVLKKIKRTCFVANMWMSSVSVHPPSLDPVNFGWKIVDGHYAIQWYDGDHCPRILDVVCEDAGENDDSNDEIDEELTQEGTIFF